MAQREGGPKDFHRIWRLSYRVALHLDHSSVSFLASVAWKLGANLLVTVGIVFLRLFTL